MIVRVVGITMVAIVQTTVGLVALGALGAPLALATALDVKASGEKTFYLNPRAANSQITIFSRAPLEDFTTVSNRVSGEWRVDPKNLESTRGRFAMRIEDLRTGLDVRDRDLRGPDWFDAARFPEIKIEISRVTGVKKTGPNTASMTLVGVCSMHGHTNPVSIPATLAYLDESPLTMKLGGGDVIRIRAEFTLRLSDFGVTGPPGTEMIGFRVANEQEVKVALVGVAGKPPEEVEVHQPRISGAAPAPAPLPPPR